MNVDTDGENIVNRTTPTRFSREHESDLGAIVLSGGRSSRMGRDKAAIVVRSMPLLTRICHVALAVTPTVFVVTSRAGVYEALVPQPCQIVQEPEAFQGPLAGLLWGWREMATEWVLVLACDLPKLTAPVVQQWTAQLVDTPTDAIAFLPQSTKGWEPLCGFYRRRSVPLLQAYWRDGGRSLQQWLRGRKDIRAIPDVSSKLLFNCNTPKDLEQMLADTESP